jgi:hypothetical protein
MVTQSYKKSKYKCAECGFVGQNKVTMEVHMGKMHSENFGCDLEAGSLANLEDHLNTMKNMVIWNICKLTEMIAMK